MLWCLQSVGSMDLYQLGLTFEVGVWSVKKKKKKKKSQLDKEILDSANFKQLAFIFLFI